MRRCIVLLVLVMLGMFSFAWAQPMSGTYTIPGNYPNFNAVISALVSNGVDGAVVFEVSPGTYVEQMVIPQIPSASAENTITFTGTGTRNEVIIQYAPDEDDPYMVRLDGARHFRFDNFTFNVATGASYGFVFHIQNASEDIEITNSIFNNFEATTAFYTHILVSNNNLAYGAGDSHDILIADNVFNDGFTAVRCNGTATEQLTGIEIRNNVINQTYSHGIWLVQNYAPIIEANLIDIRSEEPAMDINSGMNLSQVHGPFLISKNKITNPGRHGINLMSGETSPTNRSRIVNNSVGGGFRDSDIYGGAIRISGTVSNLDIFYNSLNLDYGEGSALNVRIATVSGLNIRNNSFAYTGNENGFAMYISNPSMVDALDHNNYYSTDSNFIYYGSAIDDLTALQAVNIPVGNDANSREGNPFYTSPLDLYTLGTQLWAGATPIPGIDEDIEGNPRDDTAPCIGAYEYDALQNDLAAFDIAGPNVAYIGASATYSVTVINFGVNTQDDYTVKLMKEGEVELASAHITTPLEANQSIDLELDWIPSMEETTYVYGKVVLIGDENPDNDETDILPVEVLTESLQGTYSINWDGTGDYDSFNQALDDLMDLGVSEPVTFLVHPGTYNEQLFFDGEIPNASSVNTVTFTGIDNERLDAILQFAPASSEDRYVVRFDGTKHVRLDNLKIEAIDTADWGWTVHIMSGCQDIEITNCDIITNVVSIATDYMGIVISGSETSHTAAASNVSDILIENNSIIGGNRGITCRGDSSFDNIQGLQILNNVIDQSHHHGVWIYHATTPLIQHNIIDVRTTMGTSRGISLSYIYGGFDVSYNYITNAGQYGLHLNMSPATADNPNLIYNNSIGGGFRVTSAAGLYLSSSHTHVIYNSINMDYGTQAALRTMAASSNFVALNNSFAYTGDANGYAVYHSHTANVLQHDYNNYYSGTSTNLIYYGGAFDNLGPLQNDGHDLNSHVGNPLYTSNTNLYPTGSQLYAVGTPIPGIVDDILGTPRDDDNPCIGAYEFELPVQPELEVSPDSAHFATTVGGTSLPTSFTLTNIGGGTLAINDGDIVFTGDDADEFELGELTYPIELGSGETIDISVAFSPQTDGDKTAILEITHSGVNSPYEVSLTGLAYPDNTYIFGVGTEVNNTTTANPINIYYRSLRGQMIYHASELEAAGFEQGNAIIEFGFYVEQEPLYPLPDFIIRMKHTEEDNVAAHDPGPYETVYTTASYMPTPGDWDMIVLDTPFIWNGADNILVDTAFDLVPEYNSSGQQRIYDVPNGFRYIRSDTQNTTNITTNVITSNKPQARMVFTDEALFPQIAVDPEEFVVDIDYGDIITLPITITNDGDADLTFNIEAEDGDNAIGDRISASLSSSNETNRDVLTHSQRSVRVDWLSFDPESGTVEPQEEVIVDVTFDSDGLDAGVYTANIIIEHNAGDDVIIPVTLTVIMPEITVEPDEFDVTMEPNEILVEELIIGNIGDADLTFNIEAEDGDDAIGDRISASLSSSNETNRDVLTHSQRSVRVDWLSFDPESGTVEPQEEVIVDVTFDSDGLDAGVYTANIIIEHNAGDPVLVPVTMEVVIPELPMPTNLEVDSIDDYAHFTWDEPDYEPPLELIEYDVYLDGEYIDTTEDTEYQFYGLINGVEYEAGVVAVYNLGESDMATIDFIYEGVEADELIPTITQLHNNYPNPFNPATTIEFSLKEAGYVTINVYNIRGALVRTLVNDYLEAAHHSVVWDGMDNRGNHVSSGVYFFRMVTDEYTKTRKMIMMK